MPKPGKNTEIMVLAVEHGICSMNLIGRTPLIFNRMSEKAKRQLLSPSPRRKAIERVEAKHNPLQEYRDSVYRRNDGPTLLYFPTTAFKAAMATASADIKGVAKAQINRLVYLPEDKQSIYGMPQLLMSVVRSADIQKTPDIRTRAILPAWGVRVTMAFVKPILNEEIVATLLANAGITVGIGDFRQEKGKGSHGTFELVADNDPRWRQLQDEARAVQTAALETPQCYDDESADLFNWWKEQAGQKNAA